MYTPSSKLKIVSDLAGLIRRRVGSIRAVGWWTFLCVQVTFAGSVDDNINDLEHREEAGPNEQSHAAADVT